MELVYKDTDPPTFLHYNGNGTNPDLLLVSSDIANHTTRTVLEDPGSGHRIIVGTIRLPRRITTSRAQKVSWNFNKADWPAYTASLERNLDNSILNFTDHPDKLYDKIRRTIIHTAKKHIPLGRQKRYKCFWNKELSTLKKERDSLRKIAEDTKNPTDVQKWRRSAALTQRTILEAKRACFNTFISKLNYRTDSRKAYKFIETLQNRKVPPKKELLLSNDTILNSDSAIANAFATYYSSCQKKSKHLKRQNRIIQRLVKENIKSTMTPTSNRTDNIFYENFNLWELQQAINTLKPKKSPGPDKRFNEFLIFTGPNARNTLLHFFNHIWNTTVPTHWQKAIIIPLLKRKKSPKDLSNYRPISLTSTIAKIMERMIINRMNWYLEKESIIHPEQAGFRSHRSTEQQVIILSQHIKDNLDKGLITAAVYIDFNKAYDSIWRANLLLKLSQCGIKGKMLQWIRHFLNQRYCQVRYGDATSSYKQLQTGLPQGAVTSCSMFNVYINDLIPTLKKNKDVHVLLYADDLVLWTSAPKYRAKEIIETKLNRTLDDLHKWCTVNAMSINTSKSAYQTFSLSHKPVELHLALNDEPLTHVSKFKYLGVTLDTKLTWKAHIDDLTTKSQRRFAILKRLAGCQWGCATTTLNTTYQMYIKPVLKYLCGALITASDQQIQKLELIQNQAMRLITGGVKTTPISSMLLHTGNLEIKADIAIAALKTHEKLICLPGTDLLQKKKHYNRRLKNQDGFLQKVTKVRNELNISWKTHQLLLPANPLECFHINYYLDLINNINKDNVPLNVLRDSALETIHIRYPAKVWLHIYTDGSQIEKSGLTGAGIHSELFSIYFTLGTNHVSFDGEIKAITIALQQLLGRTSSFSKVVILSDCKSAISSIGNYNKPPKHQDILDSRQIIKSLTTSKKEVVLQWIPAHCGIAGNEAADFLAKKATTILQATSHQISYQRAAMNIQQKIKDIHKKKLEDQVMDKQWKDSVCRLPDWPRKTAVSIFRLTIGHDCLGSHLHRMGILDSPQCKLCSNGEPQNRDHLITCSALSTTTLVDRYWETRRRMMNS